MKLRGVRPKDLMRISGVDKDSHPVFSFGLASCCFAPVRPLAFDLNAGLGKGQEIVADTGSVVLSQRLSGPACNQAIDGHVRSVDMMAG